MIGWRHVKRVLKLNGDSYSEESDVVVAEVRSHMSELEQSQEPLRKVMDRARFPITDLLQEGHQRYERQR